jgi:hypothetical protein
MRHFRRQRADRASVPPRRSDRHVSTSDAITAVLADALRARDITVNGVAPGLEPPGAAHDIADLVALLDRWRRSPGE